MRMAMLWFLVLVGCLHSSPIPQSDDTSSPPSIGRTLLQLKKLHTSPVSTILKIMF
ncbi:hypothetical protein HanRHA438_Chr13g0605791 [Helianthus annuus]|nr:hypothetical protein HanRHA438_Chr13g0605791 [Helianthus annuus]